MVAEFISFYKSYTVESVLQMYAVTFYSLLGAMYRLKAGDRAENAYAQFAASNGGDVLTSYIEQQNKQAGGAHALLEEVKLIKGKRNA